MKPSKPSQVFSQPYDKWSRRLNQFGGVNLTLFVVILFYHPLWLSIIAGICWAFTCLSYVILFTLQIRKNRKLAKLKKHK